MTSSIHDFLESLDPVNGTIDTSTTDGTEIAYIRPCHVSAVFSIPHKVDDKIVSDSHYVINWDHFTFEFGDNLHSVDFVNDCLWFDNGVRTFATLAPSLSIQTPLVREKIGALLRKLIRNETVVEDILSRSEDDIDYCSETNRNCFSSVHDHWFNDEDFPDHGTMDVAALHYLPAHLKLDNLEPWHNVKMLWWCNNFCRGKVYFVHTHWSVWTKKDDLVRFRLTFA
jgi:hypothetical protein